MKKAFIIANWKSNKTIKETEEWLHEFHKGLLESNFDLGQKEIIIASSFTSLEHANYCASNLKLPVKFAAQNISPFDKGAFTGEVNAEQIKELVNYVLIGHSERRDNFFETAEMLSKKASLSIGYGLTPIFCIQNKQTLIPKGVKFIAYEPVGAIGTGNPDTPENANEVANSIKSRSYDYIVFYGGSVTSNNVKSFTSKESLNGVLVGEASLNPLEFLKIVKNA